MVTKEEWSALEKRVKAWEEWRYPIKPKTVWACITCNQLNDPVQETCCRCGKHR